jgi:hypothetical protein
MKTNTFDLQQEILQSSVPSGLNSYVIMICCLLVILAYILGYTAGSYNTGNAVGSGNAAGVKHPTYGRFGHVAEQQPVTGSAR